MSSISVRHLSKHFGDTPALDDVSIDFKEGEFFGLLGPSGSGKTTLLRAIAGFITPDAGEIAFDGERMDHVPVHRRGIGMVFQNYALFPHLTVAENIAFGLEVQGLDPRTRVEEMLELVRLPGLGKRRPRELSGGQQQRVALARALAPRPRVLLLDEPLGALDRRLRQEMQIELREIQAATGVTAIFVTHDQEEALTLSDRIAIIDQGRLVQVGRPRDVYERPETVFAARFLGDANLFTGTPCAEGLKLASGQIIAASAPSAHLIIRPEKLRFTDDQGLTGKITQTIYSGASVTYHVTPDDHAAPPLLVFAQNASSPPLPTGSAVTLSWDAKDAISVAP